ncbi:hypothetical protein, partial [Oceanithermus sp.]
MDRGRSDHVHADPTVVWKHDGDVPRQVRGDPEKVLTPGEDEPFAAAPLYPCATILKLLGNAHFICGRRYAADGIDRLGSCPHMQGKRSREFLVSLLAFQSSPALSGRCNNAYPVCTFHATGVSILTGPFGPVQRSF